jgi:hypothetical protein
MGRRLSLKCGAIVTAFAVLGLPAAAHAATSVPAQVSSWQTAIRSAAAPGYGCYRASYPATTWTAAQCSAAPSRPFSARPGAVPSSLGSLFGPSLAAPAAAPEVIGDGNDYSAVVTGKITKAAGSFYDVTPRITETSQGLSNSFSLQINSQFFNGPACVGSSDPAGCLSWEQFVYSTSVNEIFMQYWLIYYDATCPSGWYTDGNDCYTNSPAVVVTQGPLTAADLAGITFQGKAALQKKDAVVLTLGGQAVMVSAPDTKVHLAKYWNTTEFNVFGDGNGSQAKFGPNTTLNAKTAITGTSTKAPKCVAEGFTAETNNLSLTTTPALAKTKVPTMEAAQTNGTTTTASCATAK